MSKLILILCSTLWMISSATAENSLEIFTLKHQLAKDLQPSLEAILGPNDVISSKDNLLIIRSSVTTLEKLRPLIQQLDQPVKQLLIEVQQPIRGSKQHQQLQLSVQAKQNNDTQINLHSYRTNSRDSANHSQQLHVLNGQTAFIKAGKKVPMASKQIDHNGQARTVIEHKDISSGFQIRPILIGEQVTLYISPFSNNLASKGGTIEHQQLHTSITTSLGEWVELGGAGTHSPHAGSLSTHNRNSIERSVYIRATLTE